ncbi:hypothetical protein BOTBODRAFT_115737, partial [Botryobasidium botryosum FD-172 SS1]
MLCLRVCTRAHLTYCITGAKGSCLVESVLECIRAFNFKVDTCLPANSFHKLKYAFPALSTLPSLAAIQTQMTRLSGLVPMHYDCCINSCCCFTGPFAKLTQCPFEDCGEPRFQSDGKTPRKQFSYLPLTPRLVQLFASEECANAVDYRSNFAYDPRKITDVFSSARYQRLLGEPVTIAGQPLGHRFFSDRRDIALGLAIDGFAPFRNRKQT